MNREEDFKNRQFDWELWKKLYLYVKAYRKMMISLGIIMIANGAIEASLPMLSKYAVDHFIVEDNLNGVVEFAIVYLALIIIQAILVWLLILIAGRIDQGGML